MARRASKFVWYDLMTTDVDAAEDFYSGVIGWKVKDSGMEGPRYTLLLDGERMVGGIMPIPEDAAAVGVAPAWMGYVGVADVGAKAKEIEKEGGAVHRGPQDIPGVGRFAVVSDPQGARFIVFQANPVSDAAPEPAPFMAPKTIGWHELHAGDKDEAWPFYEKLFGWEKKEEHDMGPFTYQTFGTGGDVAVGGMMTKMPEAPQPFWNYYISVEDIDAAAKRVEDNDGTMILDIMQVPGGIWIAAAKDPQGAHFNLIGPRK